MPNPLLMKAGIGLAKKIGKKVLGKKSRLFHMGETPKHHRRHRAVLSYRDLKGARRVERLLKRFGMRPKTRLSMRRRRM